MPFKADHLVEGALQGALGRRAVVADDVVDERVVEDADLFECADEAADVVVHVLEEAGVVFHLARQDRPHLLRRVLPCWNLVVALRRLCVGRDDAELFLPGERQFALPVPAVVELAFVLVGPRLRHMVRSVGRTRREIHEELLVWHQRLLLAHPGDRLVGQVLGEVVALIGRAPRMRASSALDQGRIPLICLAADEPEEMLKPGTCRPAVERAGRARLPSRDFVALAELRRRVAVQLEDLGQRRASVGPHRGVAGRRCRHLGDATHADRMMIAAAEKRGARRRANRRRVEARVLQPLRRQSLGSWRVAWATKSARRAEAHVIEQHHQHVRRPGGRPQRLDRRELVLGVFGVVCRVADRLAIGDRQYGAFERVTSSHVVSCTWKQIISSSRGSLEWDLGPMQDVAQHHRKRIAIRPRPRERVEATVRDRLHASRDAASLRCCPQTPSGWDAPVIRPLENHARLNFVAIDTGPHGIKAKGENSPPVRERDRPCRRSSRRWTCPHRRP
jgi:hypothetical protein